MAKVNTPRQFVPESVRTSNPDLFSFLSEYVFWSWQMFQRTGGNNDDVENALSAYLPGQAILNAKMANTENELEQITQLLSEALAQNSKLESVIATLSASIDLVVVETTIDYSQTKKDDVIVCTGSLIVTLEDPALANRLINIRNISGTTTLTPSVGTTEITSLSVGVSVTMVPRATGWFVI